MRKTELNRFAQTKPVDPEYVANVIHHAINLLEPNASPATRERKFAVMMRVTFWGITADPFKQLNDSVNCNSSSNFLIEESTQTSNVLTTHDMEQDSNTFAKPFNYQHKNVQIDPEQNQDSRTDDQSDEMLTQDYEVGDLFNSETSYVRNQGSQTADDQTEDMMTQDDDMSSNLYTSYSTFGK